MESLRERFGKYANYGVIGACVLAWLVAFRFGFASSEWTGFWSSAPPTRGNAVVIKEKIVETTAEKQRRLAKQAKQTSEISEKMQDLRKDFLGNQRPTEGVTPREKTRIPRDIAGYTQRDVCFQMKLENPERFADVDCMSDKFDDTEPWYKAPRH